jgi:lysophospholipase L1-like esterase
MEPLSGVARFRVLPVALLAGLAAALTLEARAITIMPLGDSLTDGYSTTYTTGGGYRTNLYTGLTAAGYQVQFEGSSTDNPSSVLKAANETQHEGHPGIFIGGDGVHSGILDNLGAWFSTYQPDIVLLMIGTNDIAQDFEVSSAPQRLGAVLDGITTLDPHAEIIVSTLIYSLNPGVNQLITNFNASLPAVVTSRSNVDLVNNSGLLNVATDYSDTFHLDRQGYDKLGAAFATEVESALAPEPNLKMVISAVLLVFVTSRYLVRRR